MLETLEFMYFMDGNGPYVWSSLLFLLIVLVVNTFVPIRRMEKIRSEKSKQG